MAGVTLEIIDCEQRSPEWYAARAGIVTASVVSALVTPSTLKPAMNDSARGLVAALVAERITGYVEPTFQSAAMWDGVAYEPLARDAYSERYEKATECGFMVRREDDWTLGFSPDGLVGDEGFIEIKVRRQKKHLQTILADAVPAENMAQIQAGFLVSGRQWCDYLSYCGGMHLWRKRVYPDPAWLNGIQAAVEQFELAAAVMVATYSRVTADLPLTERMPDLSEVF